MLDILVIQVFEYYVIHYEKTDHLWILFKN